MDSFRNYEDADDKVVNTYKLNHENQTVDFVKEQHKKYFTYF